MDTNFTKIKASPDKNEATSGAQMETAINGNLDKIKQNLVELDGKIMPAADIDAKIAANSTDVLNSAKADATQKANTAQTNANAYTDGKVTDVSANLNRFASPQKTYPTLAAMQADMSPKAADGQAFQKGWMANIVTVPAGGTNDQEFYYYEGTGVAATNWKYGGKAGAAVDLTPYALKGYSSGETPKTLKEIENQVFVTRSAKNLFNINDPDYTATIGYYMNYTTGNMAKAAETHPQRCFSGFIPVKPGFKLLMLCNPKAYGTSTTSYAFFRADKTFLGGGASEWPLGGIVTVPANAGYLRVNSVTMYTDRIQVLEGRIAGEDPLIPSKMLSYGETERRIINILEKENIPVNVLNPNAITGKSLNEYGSVYIDNAARVITDFARCKSGTRYIVSSHTFYATTNMYLFEYYSNDDRCFIASKVITTTSGREFTTSPSTKYIRIVPYFTGITSGGMISEAGDSENKIYCAYPNTGYPNSGLSGVWILAGDSMTETNTWAMYAASKICCEIRNRGAGGTRLAESSGSWKTSFDSSSKQYIDDDATVITHGFGANDWGGSVQIGDGVPVNPNSDIWDNTAPKYNTNTVKGALSLFIERCSTKFPEATLFIITPTVCAHPNDPRFTGVAGEINPIGLSMQDYRNAMVDVANKYSIPVIDLTVNCGWNGFNIVNFAGDFVHPNFLGSYRYGSIVAEAFDKYNVKPAVLRNL